MVNYLANRYVIQEEIGTGSMGVVYRAYDRLTAQVIAIKRIKMTNASAEQRMLFAQEFRTLATLRFPYIISVLDYGFDENQIPFIAMEFLQNAQPIHSYARSQGYSDRLKLILQLLQAIAYLHRRKIIHRDIKPENVLIVNGVVKVLDFGLATFTELLNQGQNDSALVGTLAYMSPELLGGNHSELSDLYAVGIIAYEILVGEYPFESHNVQALLHAITQSTLDTMRIDAPYLIQEFVGKLAAKSPKDRYQSATEAIQAFLNAVEDPTIIDEFLTIQEGFLRSAHFVGRERELAQLQHALTRLEGGTGSFWLVGGQSGIGKSRLLREFQTQVLVDGIFVFNGQAERDVAVLYQMWRTVLLHLCLQVEIFPEESSILKGILPEISRLLDSDVPDAPLLTPQENQERLIAVVQRLFKRLQKPCVILLEDIHWATEGLVVLEQIIPLIHQYPIMIVASYRSDEESRLIRQFERANHIMLERLNKEQIAALSGAILGEQIKQQSEVLQLLHHETEGNVLFILEVLRVLSTYTGGLENIGKVTLPQDAFAGGIQKLIEHRFERLSATTRKQIQLVALIGRQVDLKLLEHLAPTIDWQLNFSQWGELAIFEIVEGKWQFIHDKFREYILSAIPPKSRTYEHARIAQAIETFYPDDKAYYPVLAYHWQQAQNTEKELHYTYLSGQQSLANGAYIQAAEFFERSLALLEILPTTQAYNQIRLQTLITLGMTLIPIRGETSSEALRTFEAAQELSLGMGEVTEIFKVLYNQSIYYMSTAELERALSLSEQCVERALGNQDDDLIIEGYYARSNILFWLGRFSAADQDLEKIIAMYDAQRFAHHATEYGQDPFTVALTYGIWGKWILGYPDRATAYGLEALALTERHKHRSFNLAMSVQGLAWLYCQSHEVAQARLYAQRLADISKEHGFVFYSVIAQVILGWVQGREGNLQVAQEWIHDGIVQWQNLEARLLLPFYWLLLADVYVFHGKADQALDTLDVAIRTAKAHQELAYLAELYRQQAEAYALKGDLKEAESSLAQARQISQEQGALMFQLRIQKTAYKMKPSQANKSALAGIYQQFSEGFQTPDLQDVANLLT